MLRVTVVLEKGKGKLRIVLLFKAVQHFLRDKFIVVFEKWTSLHKSLLKHVLTVLLLAHKLRL